MSMRSKRTWDRHVRAWTDEQLQRAWDNPPRRKDGQVSDRGLKLSDAIWREQKRRRETGKEIGSCNYPTEGTIYDR